MNYLWDVENREGYKNRFGYYKFRVEYNFIQEFLSKHPIKVIDICGGSGRMAIPISEAGHQVTVSDFDDNALSVLRKRNNEILTINKDLKTFSLDEKYDFALMIEAMQYLKPVEFHGFLQEISLSLNPNGCFVFNTVNTQSWRFQLRKIRKYFQKNNFEYQYLEIDKLNSLLKKCEFEVIKVSGMNWIPLPVNSDSIFVNLFSYLENILKLRDCTKQSPWLLYAVKKISHA